MLARPGERDALRHVGGSGRDVKVSRSERASLHSAPTAWAPAICGAKLVVVCAWKQPQLECSVACMWDGTEVGFNYVC